MNNADMPISGECPNSTDAAWAAARVGGLTKREHFAGLVLANMASSEVWSDCSWPGMAKQAIEGADALLKGLDND